MKKRIIGIIFICVCAICIFTNLESKKDSTDINLLSLQNIEALAAGEGGFGDFVCYGSGTVDCPNGTKVEIYIGNLSLD